MRYLVVSDIHSNLEALAAVLANVTDYDRLLCLGDLVGYAATPNEVVRRIRRLKPAAIVRGNHDKVCAGVESGDNFNTNALLSAMWTHDQLSPRNRDYVRGLPAGPLRVDPQITICHGSPMDEDYYILYENDAYLSFQCFETPFCFFGHTHVPGLFVLEERNSAFYYFIPRERFETKLDLSGATRYLVNPGSVGQPRDYDPRASCAVLDTERATLSFLKIPYDIGKTIRRIQLSGLPGFLADRLLSGV
jgi:diadenosine tetraphosphatase ApaH/serine/threonine PP2A family protein phosphatase